MSLDLGFDIYAMVRPKTQADIDAVLDEACSAAQHINETLKRAFENTPEQPKE